MGKINMTDQPADVAVQGAKTFRTGWRIQLATILVVGIDYFLFQLEVWTWVTISLHVVVIAGALGSSVAMYFYYEETTIPGFVALSREMGHRPKYIGPYSSAGYLCVLWFFVVVGYAFHTATLFYPGL